MPAWRTRLRWTANVASAAILSTIAVRADAADFEVTADTAFQAYEVTGPWGDVVVDRRRFMQTIGLAAYNLQGAYEPGKADYRVVMRLRLDGDFGINSQYADTPGAGGETTYHTAAGDGVHYIPGLSEAPVDLMYGYVEGRNLANGLLGFRLGRQYITDVLGWWSFDGGLVRVTTPYFLQVELYGGFEQRGGLPLSTSRFEQQGVWRGSHADFGTADGQPSVSDYPSYLFTEPAPAFGFAIESNGPSFIHGRFDYRRVYNTGEAITQQFPDPSAPNSSAPGGYKTIDGTRISSDRLGYALDANKSDLGGVKGGIAYDLYTQNVTRWYAGAEGYLGSHVTLGADYEYFWPTFDADSIWNWFTHSPVTTITGRADIRFTKRFDMSLSGGSRTWSADGDPQTFGEGQCKAAGQPANCYRSFYLDPSNPVFAATVGAYSRSDQNRDLSMSTDALGNLAARYRWGSGQVNLRGMFETGARGHRVGADVDGEKKLDGGRFTVGARTSLYDWEDPEREDRSATSFGYVLAGGFHPATSADFRVEWEHDMNRLVGQRYRIVALLDVKVLR
ncbi:MAG TPA: hypothetical protein VHB21_09075 [Minicystis sp.]|nr:hypothetical protein [Minicystis sp.]